MKSSVQPPHWISKLLRWFCPDHLLEEIEGDLFQKFEKDIELLGEDNARRKIIWNVIRYFRPGIVMRNSFSVRLNQACMFRNYFKVMTRNMAKQKFHSAINLLGLTVGSTFALLIGIFVWGEMQVNKGLKDVGRLFLLETNYVSDESSTPPFFVPALMGPQAVEQYPAVFEKQYRFRDRNVTISKKNKHFRVQSMIGDSTFFEMFGFPVLYGQSSAALRKPDEIVITEKIARQFFDKIDVVGETLTVSTELSGRKEYAITAVLSDLQRKNSVSDFMNSDAQVFLSLENKADFNLDFQDDWNTSIITYIKTTPTASVENATALLNQILRKSAPEKISENKAIKLGALSDYYLVTNHGSVKNLLGSLALITLFILLLAIFNFINISLASSFSRLKEVGVRKVIGGTKSQVVLQFMGESIILAITSGFLSLVLYQTLHGYFGELLDVSLPTLVHFGPSFWLGIVASIFLIGILAGGYPSLYLSGTHTIESLKGKFKSVKGTIRLSRGLIAFQFLVAIFVFTASLIMSEQVTYVMKTDLGYNKSFVMVATSLPRMWSAEGLNKMDVAKHEFMASPKVKSVSLSWGAPSFPFSPHSVKINHVGNPIDQGIVAKMSPADEDYAQVFGLDVSAGKFFFDDEDVFQPNQLVINETAQKELSAQVGDKVRIQFEDNEFTIVGIVKDFNFESLHEPVKAVAFIHTRDFGAFRYFSFKLHPGDLTKSIQDIENVWKKVFPNDPFEYSFTDERMALLYQTEFQLKKASAIGSVLILIIVLTGVLGLVSLSVAKRGKEIGIRKVLGATASNILTLVSGEYAMLLTVAFLGGVPLSYVFSSSWLSNFAYHIGLTWWMFVLPFLFLFLATILIVSAQSIKSALSKPADSLRYE